LQPKACGQPMKSAQVRSCHCMLDVAVLAWNKPQPLLYIPCCIAVWHCRKYHIIKYEAAWQSALVHHSVTYVCQPGSQAETEARQLMKSSGPGPYNLDKHVKICTQIYMVRRPSTPSSSCCGYVCRPDAEPAYCNGW
jgi:hypothetical protein